MKNLAHLKSDSPFYPLFEGGRVPIKNIIIPTQAICEGDNNYFPQDVYMVDLDKLSPAQFESVVKLVHANCDPSTPLEVARKEIKARGLPLRAKHVQSVSSDAPFFL